MNLDGTAYTPMPNHLLLLNIQAGLLAIIVAATCLAGQRWLTPGWRSLLWMMVFVRIVLPIGPTSDFSLANLWNTPIVPQVQHNPLSAQTSNEITVINIDPDDLNPSLATPLIGLQSDATSPTSSASGWSIRDAVLVTWLIISAVLLARLAWLNWQLQVELSRLQVVDHQNLIAQAGTAAAEAGLVRLPHMLWGPAGCSPAVYGWWLPILILPTDAASLQPTQLRAVLLHEFRHIRAGDTLVTWLPRLMCALFWFNPLLWWASRKWHEERELACDEWVIGQLGQGQKQSYLETLVVIATRSPRTPSLVFTASIDSSYTLLERRIIAMKRFRPPTWAGLIAGTLLTLAVGAIGLTDARAANDAADQQSTAVAVVQQDNPSRPAEPKTLKPKVTFARHVILWEGIEILSREELQDRLAKLRATQSVKPQIYHSLGFIYSSGDLKAPSQTEVTEFANAKLADTLKLIGQDQWSLMTFLSRRGSAAVDRIRTADDLKLNAARSVAGRVVQPVQPGGSKVAASGAQVIILPLGEPGDIYLRNGQLRNPEEEIWYATNANGDFQAEPESLHYDSVLLYGEGNYMTLIVHETGYLVINDQLTANATYELLPWTEVKVDTRNLKENQSADFWTTPEEAHSKFPELVVATVRHSDEPVTIKVPQGKARFAYHNRTGDEWSQVADSNFRYPVQIDGPAEITLPAAP